MNPFYPVQPYHFFNHHFLNQSLTTFNHHHGFNATTRTTFPHIPDNQFYNPLPAFHFSKANDKFNPQTSYLQTHPFQVKCEIALNDRKPKIDSFKSEAKEPEVSPVVFSCPSCDYKCRIKGRLQKHTQQCHNHSDHCLSTNIATPLTVPILPEYSFTEAHKDDFKSMEATKADAPIYKSSLLDYKTNVDLKLSQNVLTSASSSNSLLSVDKKAEKDVTTFSKSENTEKVERDRKTMDVSFDASSEKVEKPVFSDLMRSVNDFRSKNRLSRRRISVKGCTICSYVPLDRDDMYRHRLFHNPRMLQCPLARCTFATQHKHHFDYHIKSHQGLKKFKCLQCNYRCINKSMLKSHEKCHSLIYSYRCTHCSFASKHAHPLNVHIAKTGHVSAAKYPRATHSTNSTAFFATHQTTPSKYTADNLPDLDTSDESLQLDEARKPMLPVLPYNPLLQLFLARTQHLVANGANRAGWDENKGAFSFFNWKQLAMTLDGRSKSSINHNSLENTASLRHNYKGFLDYERLSTISSFMNSTLKDDNMNSGTFSFLNKDKNTNYENKLQEENSVINLKINNSNSVNQTICENNHKAKNKNDEKEDQFDLNLINTNRFNQGTTTTLVSSSYQTEMTLNTQKINSQVEKSSFTNYEGNLSTLASDKDATVSVDQCTVTATATSWLCVHCQVAFCNQGLFEMHSRFHGEIDPFDCRVCRRRCTDAFAFFSHLIKFSHFDAQTISA